MYKCNNSKSYYKEMFQLKQKLCINDYNSILSSFIFPSEQIISVEDLVVFSKSNKLLDNSCESSVCTSVVSYDDNDSTMRLYPLHQNTPEFSSSCYNNIKNNDNFSPKSNNSSIEDVDFIDLGDYLSYEKNPNYKTENSFYSTRPVLASKLLVKETTDQIPAIVAAIKKYHQSTIMLPHLSFTPNKEVTKECLIVYKIDGTTTSEIETKKRKLFDEDLIANQTPNGILVPSSNCKEEDKDPSFCRLETKSIYNERTEKHYRRNILTVGIDIEEGGHEFKIHHQYRHPSDVQKSVLIIRRPTIASNSLNNDDFDNEYNFQLQQSGMREVEQNTVHIGYL